MESNNSLNRNKRLVKIHMYFGQFKFFLIAIFALTRSAFWILTAYQPLKPLSINRKRVGTCISVNKEPCVIQRFSKYRIA